MCLMLQFRILKNIILNIIGTNIGYILIKLKKGEKDGQRKQQTNK